MKKVALLFICLNPPYHPYLKQVIEDCDNLFLTNRKLNCQVDYFVWTDIKTPLEGVNVIETEPVQWPYPTLLRYNLFLQKEEDLSKYDYIFYLDADMRVVSPIGAEILGEGLTIAEHPMYSFRKEMVAPLEPNPQSAAFVKRFGGIIVDPDGKQRFKPFYAAGGFQGGTSKAFIEAMKAMRDNINKDLANNYMAIWNDESHWNKYLSDYQGHCIVLTPSYVYPDSLIKEFYEPRWGCSYQPKIITITKPFSTSKEGGEAVKNYLQST